MEINELTIILTEQCNLQCSYCLQTHNKKSINIKKAYKKFKELYDFKSMIRVEFFGGEPFLEYQKIKYFINELDKENFDKKLITFKVNSNGTIMNNELYDLLKHIAKNYNLEMKFSFDGLWQNKRSDNKEINFQIERNLNNLFQKCLSQVSSISFSVLDDGDRLLENYLYLKERFKISDDKISHYLIREPWVWDSEKLEKYKKGFEKFVKYSLFLWDQTGYLHKYIRDKLEEFKSPKLGCGMGFTRFTILPDINNKEDVMVSPCNLDNDFKNIDQIIPYQQIEINCGNCSIKDHCNKICPKKILYSKDEINYYCELKKIEYYAIQKYDNFIQRKLNEK